MVMTIVMTMEDGGFVRVCESECLFVRAVATAASSDAIDQRK